MNQSVETPRVACSATLCLLRPEMLKEKAGSGGPSGDTASVENRKPP